MKTRTILLMLLALTFATVTVNAQQNSKDLKKEIKKKPVKEAKKEAKKFAKDGYKVAPGALPMGKQIEAAWMRQYEMDEDGYPLYIVASGNSVANTTSAAKLQATELAKLELVEYPLHFIFQLVEGRFVNHRRQLIQLPLVGHLLPEHDP